MTFKSLPSDSQVASSLRSLHLLGAGHPGADVVTQPAADEVAVEVPKLLVGELFAHAAVDLREPNGTEPVRDVSERNYCHNVYIAQCKA